MENIVKKLVSDHRDFNQYLRHRQKKVLKFYDRSTTLRKKNPNN